MPRTVPVFSKDKPAGCTISTNSIHNRLHDVENLGSCDLEDLCVYITQHACQPCSGKRQGCVCALVPRLAWLFEKYRDEWYADLVEVSAFKLHTHLPLLATALLKRGHSTRAFRRATEAFDMLVMSVLDPDESEPGRHLAHLTNSASDSWSTATSGSSREPSPTSGNRGSPAGRDVEASRRRAGKVEVAVHVGKCGLLAELLKEAQQLKQQWGETHRQLTELAAKIAPAGAETAAPASSRELVQQLHAAAAPMREASGLDRSQELYSWATYLITIWPSDILTAPAAAGVVTAAAEVAAWHLQSMADIQRVNALLTAQRRRPLPLPRLGGVAAAVELAKCAVEELVTYIPSYSDQPSLLTPLSSQQQQQQQQGPEVDFPPEVGVMIQDGYQQLLPLCATAIAFDGLQLAWLLDMKQQREQRLQQKLQGSTAAAAVADGPEGAATAAAAAGGGGGSGDCPETNIAAAADAAVAVSPRAFQTAAAAAPAGDSDVTPQQTPPASPSPCTSTAVAAGASPASPSTSSSTGSQRSHAAAVWAAAAPAAAAKAEQVLLQSAKQLDTEVPLWVSILPGWEQLLKGSWQDMGYPLELQDEVNWAGDDSDDSSSSSSDSISTCSSMDDPGDNSSPSSSVHSHFQQRLGCPFDAAYQYCVDRCVSKWLDNLQLLMYPLRAGNGGEGASSASSILASLQDGQFAAAHVAQLPVVLLASAQAALQLNSASRLELVALAANMTGQICRSCEGLSWGISAGGRQHQQHQQHQQWQGRDTKQQQQQQQYQEQQQGSKDGQGEAIWQVVGLVLQLLQQLLAQATNPQQQQGSKSQAPAVASHTADMQAAVLSCLRLLQYLVRHKLSWNFTNLQHCQRMVHILQLSEASVRYLTAAAVAAADARLKQQKKKNKKKKKQAADQDQLDKAAAAAHAEAIEPFRATIELVSHNASMTLLKAAEGLVHALPRIKRCWLQQQSQLLAQPALSLLLTVSKLPALVTSAAHCGTVCRAICAALASLARPDGDMPSRFPRKPQQHHPARLLEPHPAVMALAGRFLVHMGTLLQKQAVEDPVGACTWLSQLLVQEGTLDSEQALAGSSTQASAPGSAQRSLEGKSEQGAAAVSKGYLDELIKTVLQLAHVEPVGETVNGMLSSASSSAAAGSSSSSSSSSRDGSSSGGGSSRGMGGSTSRDGGTSSTAAAGDGSVGGIGSSASPGSTGADRSATVGSPTGHAAGKDVFTRAVRCIKQQTRFWRVELQHYNSRSAEVFTAISEIEQELADADARMAAMRGAVRAVSSHAGANLAAQKRLSIKHMQGVVDGHARRVQDARAALEAVPRGFSGQMSAYGELLRTTGLMLAARVPTRFTCNNMSCSSMATASEAFVLVRGSSCACAGCLGGTEGPAPSFCLAARYCSPACQAVHWQIHKGVCRELRQAAKGQQSGGGNPDAQHLQQ